MEDEIDVCNDSFVDDSCVDDNATICEPSTSSTPQKSSHQNKKRKLNEKNDSFQKELIQFLHKTDHVDPDKVMLNSFLPFVKNLNSSQKLDFQIYVLQYFKNLETNSNVQPPSLNQTDHISFNNSLAHYYNPTAVTQSLYPSQSVSNNSQLTIPQQNYDFLNYNQSHSSNE